MPFLDRQFQQPRPDGRRQSLGLDELRLQLLLQGGEAFGKGCFVLLCRLGSDIAARGQDVAVDRISSRLADLQKPATSA